MQWILADKGTTWISVDHVQAIYCAPFTPWDPEREPKTVYQVRITTTTRNSDNSAVEHLWGAYETHSEMMHQMRFLLLRIVRQEEDLISPRPKGPEGAE